jgi:hypothetical protein
MIVSMERIHKHRWAGSLFSNEGYALPSVLFLITILSLLTGSIITMQYLDRRLVLLEIAKVKAQDASESGLAKFMGTTTSFDELTTRLSVGSTSYIFEDSSESIVTIYPWGLFLYARSEGKYFHVSSAMNAIIGMLPSSEFENALVFANSSHQLMFAGKSSIIGNVLLGPPGASIGNLRDRSTPISIPVKGKIIKRDSPALPIYRSVFLQKEFAAFDNYLEGHKTDSLLSSHSLSLQAHSEGGAVELSQPIPDSITTVFLNGDAHISGKYHRRDKLLYIVVKGMATIDPRADFSGLIAVLAARTITVVAGANLDNSICYSKDSIALRPGAKISAQLIAPSILIDSGVTMTYPSLLCSFASDSSGSDRQNIQLKGDSRVEGTVILSSSLFEPIQMKARVTIDPNASITGSLYSSGNVTLDGRVSGSVLVRDFFFYESPTNYIGWIRSGIVDREKLPRGFMIPPGFSDVLNLRVLDWL